MKSEQKFILNAMRQARGDNLERANRAFGSLTKEQLGEQHGRSERTRAEIWESYKQDRIEWEQANIYLLNLFAKAEGRAQ